MNYLNPNYYYNQYYKKNDDLYFKFEDKEEILTSMCLISNMYLSIGKLDGNLIIYDINYTNKIYNNKIFEKSITYLMTYKEDSSSFFACSEEPIIRHLKLIFNRNIGKYNIQQIRAFKIHDSCTKILKYLENDIFASCSMDSSFVIWKLNKNNENKEILRIKDQSFGIENFFLKMKNTSFNSIITLNTKGALSFYIKDKENKPFLKKVIFDVDFTNSKSMIKRNDKIIIGGFDYLQIFSEKKMQLETKIKIESPISYIYEEKNKFLILGLKNGNLKFIKNNSLQFLKEENINQFEEGSLSFRYSDLFKKGEAQVFENESIISLLNFDGKLICISDESINIFFKNKPNTIKPKKENLFSNCFMKDFKIFL